MGSWIGGRSDVGVHVFNLPCLHSWCMQPLTSHSRNRWIREECMAKGNTSEGNSTCPKLFFILSRHLPEQWEMEKQWKPLSGNLLSTTKEVGSELQSRFHRLHYMPCKLVTTHYSSEAIRWCQLAMTSSSLRIRQGGNDATNSAEKSPHLPQVLQEPHTGYPRTTRPCDQTYQTANNMFRACKRIK